LPITAGFRLFVADLSVTS